MLPRLHLIHFLNLLPPPSLRSSFLYFLFTFLHPFLPPSLPPSLPLSLPSSITTPDQVDHAPSAPEGRIENVTQLGPNVITTFTVGNRGPSIIPESRLTIHWPLQVVKSNFYFVYPIGWRVIQVTRFISMRCFVLI